MTAPTEGVSREATTTYDQVMDASFRRFRHLRHLGQLFPRFAGAVIRAMEDRGNTLVGLDTVGREIQVRLETADEDELLVAIRPFREDLVFLASQGPWAELHVELGRPVSDPRAYRRVLEANTRSTVGTFLGGTQLSQQGAASGGARLREPGVMTLRVAGRRIHVGVTLILELGRYAGENRALDGGAIGGDLDAILQALTRYHGGVSVPPSP